MKLANVLFWGFLSLAVLLLSIGCSQDAPRKPRWLVKVDNTIYHCERLSVDGVWLVTWCNGNKFLFKNKSIQIQELQ